MRVIMKYEYLKYLKTNSKTLKLLNSDNFAFSASFFYFAFTEKRNIVLSHSIILQYLDDYLYDINQTNNNAFVKSAKDYLEDFSNDNNGYLRKYHGSEDEALYELTPHTQKALEFLESLEKREFVGSRSKFNIVFELLEELEFETNLSDDERIKKLEKQKRDIDSQIQLIKSKQDLRFDSSRIKEHYMQIDEIVRKLKYDFSEMEYNFRELNTLAMTQIVTQEESKGVVLDTIFDVEDKIRDSDQGKSFFAFFQILTDATKSEKLTQLLENLYKIETIQEFDKEQKLKDLKYTLLQSSDKISKVSSKLMEQLRRFLDDRVWAENRRVLDLCKDIQKSAIEIKDDMPTLRNFTTVDGNSVKVDTVFAKSLHSLKTQTPFIKELIEVDIEIDLESFYNTFYIDEEILKRNISEILLYKPQCTISDINDKFKITKGIAELVSYISIAKNRADATVYENSFEIIELSDVDGMKKMVKLPKIIFVKQRLQ